MIMIISDNMALAENIGEMLSIQGLGPMEFKGDSRIYDSDMEKGIDLIIYNHSSDLTGEYFEWYLIANNLEEIPVIFLTLKAWENRNENHFHLELPFQINSLESTVSHCIPMNN